MTSPTPTGDAATILAVHVGQAWGPAEIRCCGFWRPHALHAAHQADALAESGYGQVSALLTDLRALHRPHGPEMLPVGSPDYCTTCRQDWPCATARTLDRHTPTTRQETP